MRRAFGTWCTREQNPLTILTTHPATNGGLLAARLGEVLWSPRTSTLAAQIAPPGMEATFFALASAPQFLAKWPTGIFSGWLLENYVPECNRCMDSQGYYCDSQPAAGEFYALSGVGDRCFSRFECKAGTNASLNGLDFACACGADVKPSQPNGWCRQGCLGLDVTAGLTAPGHCPQTCLDCAGWNSDPNTMWLVIAVSCCVSPVAITLLRKWIEPLNPDGTPMQIGDEAPGGGGGGGSSGGGGGGGAPLVDPTSLPP